MMECEGFSRAACLTLLAGSVLFAACATKAYVAPEVQSPPAFKEGADWKPGEPADATLRGTWWELFGDDQLNTLESQARLLKDQLEFNTAKYQEAVARENAVSTPA